MQPKHAVKLGAVQETLLIPLYARAVETGKERPLLRDPKAVEVVAAIDYDFRKFDGAPSLFGCVLRTAMLDEWVTAFLQAHPRGTVVELGVGLNTRFERLDDGTSSWLELDLPDVIELRREHFSDSDRRTTVAASLLDESLVDVVKQRPAPYMFIAEAVLVYLEEREVMNALVRIARACPGARIALDTAGGAMVHNQHEHDVLRNMEARFRWACDDPREIERWGGGLRLLETRTFFDPPDALKGKVPSTRDMLSETQRRQVECYRLNLFEVTP